MQTKPFFSRQALIAAVAGAVAFGAAASSFADQAPGLTRDQVRAELMAAREAGTLSQFGEAGDTAQVLAARDAYNTAQAESIMAGYLAEQARDLALAQAEERRAAIEAEALQMGAMAQAGEVRIDVIRMGTQQ